MKDLIVKYVRHGQTFYNLMHKMQGWSDAPLTDKGIADLQKTAIGLQNTHFDAYYSSDLKRAMDTANIIIQANIVSDPSLTLITNPNFREVGFGIFEGIDDQEVGKIVAKPYGLDNFDSLIKQVGIDEVRDATKRSDSTGWAESSTDVYERIDAGFEDLLAAHPHGGSVLVVSHGGYIAMLAEKYGAKEQLEARGLPENGSVTTVRLNNDSVEVIDFARPNSQLTVDQAM